MAREWLDRFFFHFEVDAVDSSCITKKTFRKQNSIFVTLQKDKQYWWAKQEDKNFLVSSVYVGYKVKLG